MKLQFKEYSSIENVERTKEVNRLIEQGHSAGEWVVTEKIHGANFSFWVTDDGITCGKRTDMLGDNSSFFNFQDVRDSLSDALRKMYHEIKASLMPNLCGITIYGELFGGHYPHKDVERVYMAQMVQKGIYYHPGNKFAAFDMVLHQVVDPNEVLDMTGQDEPAVRRTVMDHDFVYDTCRKYGIPHVPVLFRGTFDECMAYPNEFQSKLPEMFGLPPLEDNVTEGVVLKPAQPKFFWGGGRVLLKNKNSKWTEKAKEKKPNKQANKENNFEFVPSEHATELMDELLMYVTENRLRNVLSKMERPILDRQFGMIVGNMNKDIMEEFLKDFRDRFMSLEDKERKYLNKKMGAEVMSLVRKNFVNIIDGEF